MRVPNVVLRRTSQLTICIPAYKAGAFLERTVASVQAQSFRDWRIVIANDGGHDRDEVERLRRFGKVEIHHHTRQLGWVGNSNWLIERARTPYFAILPHDDEVLPDYYGRMIELLEKEPAAICACSSIQTRGRQEDTLVPACAIRGSSDARVDAVLTSSWAGVSYRAVNRGSGRNRGLTIPRNRFGNMFSDSAWIMRQALKGEMLSCDAPLYVKHMHDSNTHMQWFRKSPETVALAWYTYCLQLAWFAMTEADSDERREKILRLSLARVFSGEAKLRPKKVQKAFKEGIPDWQQEKMRDHFREVLLRALRLRSKRSEKLSFFAWNARRNGLRRKWRRAL